MKKSDFVEIINVHKEMLQNAYCEAVDSKAANYSCGDAYNLPLYVPWSIRNNSIVVTF